MNFLGKQFLLKNQLLRFANLLMKKESESNDSESLEFNCFLACFTKYLLLMSLYYSNRKKFEKMSNYIFFILKKFRIKSRHASKNVIYSYRKMKKKARCDDL